MESLCLITFYSTHYALKAEKVLKDNGFTVDLVPVPRKLSSNCGISMSLSWGNKANAVEILKSNNVRIEKIHRWDRD